MKFALPKTVLCAAFLSVLQPSPAPFASAFSANLAGIGVEYVKSRPKTLSLSKDTTEAAGVMCIDAKGHTWTTIDVNGHTGVRRITATSSAGNFLPPCEASTMDRLLSETWIWSGTLALSAAFLLVGTFYVARKKMQHGDKDSPKKENMTYEERLVAAATLGLMCVGACFIFGVYEACLLRYMYILIWTSWVLIPLLLFVVSTSIAMRPLKYRMPSEAALRHPVFGLWRDYLGFELVYDNFELLVNVLSVKGRQFLLAQMPHGIVPLGAILGMSVAEDVLPGVWPMSGVVATALLHAPVLRDGINLLGVREAGRVSMLQMFADGFKAIAVMTGGIAEVFVSRKTERLIRFRPGFGRIALLGGHTIVPVFAFGVSRTHRVCPFFNNSVTKSLCRKFKFAATPFYGSFCTIPYRQQMKLVVGSPIIVEKATSDITKEMEQAVCDQVQAAVIKLYNDHKPAWETRPITFEL